MYDSYYYPPTHLTDEYYGTCEVFAKQFPLAQFAIVNDGILMQVFETYKHLTIFMKIYKPEKPFSYSLHGEYKTMSYNEREAATWRTEDFINRFRERYDKTPDQQYRDHISRQ